MSGGLAVSGGIRQVLRFGTVSALGTAEDLALAYALVTLVSVPIVLAASVGFAAGSVVNYNGHSVFSFQGEYVRRASVQGYVQYLGAVAMTYVTRIGTIWFVDSLDRFGTGTILPFGIAASFTVHYLASALWVFRK